MAAEADRWGVPGRGATVSRDGVLQAVTSSGGSLILITAPSGYGKSVAAAQAAHVCPGTALWLSLQGQPVDLKTLYRLIAKVPSLREPDDLLSRTSSEDEPEVLRRMLAARGAYDVWLFLDDLVAADGISTPELCTALAATLSPFVVRVVVTTNRPIGDGPLDPVQVTVIDRHELALSTDETSAIISAYGPAGLLPDEVDSICASVGGHVALLRMLVTSSSRSHGGLQGEPGVAAKILVERMLSAHLSHRERLVLEVASLLKEGDLTDLEEVGVPDARRVLVEVANLIPLVRIDTVGHARRAVFAVHDIVEECLVRSFVEGLESGEQEALLKKTLHVLASSGRWSRASAVLRSSGRGDIIAEFLETYGTQMVEEHVAPLVLQIINSVDLHHVMFRPRCILVWSRALSDVGEVDESAAKAGAAIHLAQHERDFETLGVAVSLRTQALMDQGRAQDAVESAEGAVAEHLEKMSPAVRCELLLSYAVALGAVERRQESNSALVIAERSAQLDPLRTRPLLARLARIRACQAPVWSGDFAAGIDATVPLLRQSSALSLADASVRGNLAWMFVETGRLRRAEALLTKVLASSEDCFDALFLPAMGLVRAAQGDAAAAADLLRQGHAAAVASGAEADIQINRTYEACVRRAAGECQHAFDLAERSFEQLSNCDFMGSSRLAAAEVAASLLALGDTPGARAWLGNDAAGWLELNLYHALSGAMVLAAADYREGDLEAAINRLRPLSDYIQSESGNWRMAMYCRSFPELLGLLAMAAGPERLPIHMLRMVLPEDAEKALRIAAPFMPKEAWSVLGARVLGEEQFGAFVERRGRPICRVHLFGGLDVTAGDRVVTERDWKKRKARLLFAMLVARRGQDVPRDQVLDHLWPDLPVDRAKNNFYVIWSTMKSALASAEDRDAPCPYIESQRGRCRIVRDAVRSDVDEFEELMSKARQAESSGDVEEAIAALQQLMSVYRGDLLPGDVYDDWFAPLRDKYRFEFIDAMLHGAELLLEHDDPCEAVVFVRRALAVDRHREDLYQMALRCHIAAGQRSAAIDIFIRCKTEMAEELGLDPTSETMALYQQVLVMEERPRYDSFGLSRKTFG